MLAQGGLAATSLAAIPGAVVLTILQAGSGFFTLTGRNVTLSINLNRNLPMALRRDYWDVDEWGRFMPGGGVRYTL